MLSCSEGAKIGSGCLKTNVGSFLKLAYRSRSTNCVAVKKLLAEAIESGVITEFGESERKVLTFSASFNSPNRQPSKEIPESIQSPIAVNALPDDFRTVAAAVPYLIFIRSSLCQMPSDLRVTLAQVREDWKILICASIPGALSDVETCPQLFYGRLVDWKKAQLNSTSGGGPVMMTPARVRPRRQASTFCSICSSRFPRVEIFVSRTGFICNWYTELS
jgi:hypothetical protein